MGAMGGGGGRAGLLSERAELPLYSKFSYGQIFPRKMPTFPRGQITSISPTISVGENQIFSGTTQNSHFSGEILLAGNQSHFSPGRGLGKTTIRSGTKTTI